MSQADFTARVDVSRETLGALEHYASLLSKWNPKINLVAPSTLADMWSRHFLDSAQILGLAPDQTRSWVDLGSGGGFPGLVVAILACDSRPDLQVTCVESDQRKAAFLRTVIRETAINARVLTQRVEEIPPLNAQVVSARALAPLKTLIGYAKRHLAPEGIALFPKGRDSASEMKEALETWSFRADTYPSMTNPEAVVLRIGEIDRVST